ncbi:biotin--[acetyl-CoA-carboxylase] ligase [Bacillus kwashiorkori]|uniref:biotin--[acetyl-CoA-carboxylase] ligase n=1 Tax=Bacillus kwashiorkori TaxID=1522318 RepID=UPI000784ACE4|nr:biotin--[acetyl-CoA-carboxylase] ligase [Bacillus kwashiorkori]
MKSSVRKQILDAFRQAGDQFLSGEELARTIGCSRTAVWKYMEELRKDGFQLEAVRKKGYRIIDVPHHFSVNEFYLGLTTEKIGRNLLFFDSISSTQEMAKQRALKGDQEGTIIIADEQTAGRGRMNRQWHSNKGTGIWASLIIRPKIPIQKAPQITLLTAVAIAKAIEEITPNDVSIEIKWPNDIILNGKKVCGILTELQAEENRIQSIIIGFGLNVNQQRADFPQQLEQLATSLSIETNLHFSRSKLLQLICLQFEKLYDTYLKTGFSVIKILWESYSNSIGKTITARTISGNYTGTALGITEDGVLLLQDEKKEIHYIYSADIEIK